MAYAIEQAVIAFETGGHGDDEATTFDRVATSYLHLATERPENLHETSSDDEPTAAGAAGADDEDEDGDDEKDSSSDEDPPEQPDNEDYPQPDDDEEPITVYVHVSTEQTLRLTDLYPQSLIGAVKVFVQMETGVRHNAQRLHFGTTFDLTDTRSLSSYNIQDGDLLHLQIRAVGGASKRFREQENPKPLALAEIHGVVDLLLPFVEDSTRTEAVRLDSTFDSWNVLDALPANILTPLDTKVQDTGATGLTTKRLADWLVPIFSPVYVRLQARLMQVERSLTLLATQTKLCVTRLIMTDTGFNDFKSFKALLAEKAAYRRGLDAVPLRAP